jgi:molybdate transport system substrate-binding protein
MNTMIKKILLMWMLMLSPLACADSKITVYAAASMTNAINEIIGIYEKDHPGTKISTSYAASSTLAKQIENGAPADIFISADLKWMDYLQDKKKIDAGSRKSLLGNQLVLIAPKSRGFKVIFDKSFDLSKSFDGKLCTGEVESVPAGIYAKQALIALGWWDALKPRIVGTQDVRSALMLVDRGECGAGIVYATDALISTKSEIVASFPEGTHSPVLYPEALVTGFQPEAKSFLEYLSSATSIAIFERYGFNVLTR